MSLHLDTRTWLLFCITTAAWLACIPLAGSRHERSTLGWRVLPLSLFGFAWIGFGADFVFRFLALAYDPVLFRATRYPLWLLPAKEFWRTWLCLGAYWCLLCVGMVVVIKIMPRRLPHVFHRLDGLATKRNVAALDLLASGAATAILVTWLVPLPGGLATPVGHFCSLWVIPAAMAWHMHLRGDGMRLRRYLYMLPGVLMFIISPYREHLLMLFLCVALPLIALRSKVGLLKTALAVAAALVASTVLTQVYRPVKWEGEKLAKSEEYASWRLWKEQPQSAPWTKLSMRFHGFDSAALTVWLVPKTIARVERDIPVELAVSAFLPRIFLAGKIHIQRGRLFSTSIWAYDESGSRSPLQSAMIAPSMVGDLWAAGGAAAVAMGALAWGALIGLLECWRRALQPAAASALVAFLAFRVAGGMERDFVLSVATIIQVLIVLAAVLCVVPLKAERPARGEEHLPLGPDLPGEHVPAGGNG